MTNDEARTLKVGDFVRWREDTLGYRAGDLVEVTKLVPTSSTTQIFTYFPKHDEHLWSHPAQFDLVEPALSTHVDALLTAFTA